MKQNRIERRIVDSVTFENLGFPVVVTDAPMRKIRGAWVLDIDLNILRKKLFRAMANKATRLTGNEVRFIRQYLEMTLNDFGKRVAVSHAAVKKWESKGNGATDMAWTTEKDIRLLIQEHVAGRAKEFVDLYGELQHVRPIQGKFRHKFEANELMGRSA